MSFLFLLDGIEFDPPINDKELTTTIKRGANLDGFLITQDADLTFTGAAYQYLSTKLDEAGCSEVIIDILDECEDGTIHEVYTGIIKVTTLTEDLDKCTISAKVQDNSFYSYINNNKAVEISPSQTGTKNGVEIEPPSRYRIHVFKPSDGVYDTDLRSAYRVYDLLEHAITVMSDGLVGFTSDYLWNQEEELFLTKGECLANTTIDPTFTYTFEDLYTELNKLFNLSFYIETSQYSLPTLRIEPKDYFFSTEEGISFEDLKDLKRYIDQAKVYGTVTLGSEVLNDAAAYIDFNENVPFFGFKQEKFYPIGQCNLDTELNLVNEYVLSSNVIEDCIFGSAEDYYDELIFVSCRDVDIVGLEAYAIGYELNGVSPPYIYNLNLNNYNKAQRYYGYLPNNLLNAFNYSSTNFRAEHQTLSSYYLGTTGAGTPISNYLGGTDWSLNITPFSFPDETSPGNYDLGSNYNNSTYRYTVGVDGTYSFSSSLFVDIQNLSQVDEANSFIYVRIFQYDSLNVVKTFAGKTTFFPQTVGAIVADVGGVFDCVIGDYFIVDVTITVSTTSLIPIVNNVQMAIRGTSFFMSNSDNLIVSSNSENYRILKYEFPYPLTGDQIRSIIANPTGVHTFTKWSESQQKFIAYRGWIDEIKVNNWTGLASIKMVANNALIQE